MQDDGKIWAWGRNDYGGLGDGTTTTPRKTPVQVCKTYAGGICTEYFTGQVLSIAGGYQDTSMALNDGTDGTVWSWGANNVINGIVGDGTITQRLTPVQTCQTYVEPNCVVPLTDVVTLAGDGQYRLAVKQDGTVWGWGRNSNGQLGDGTTTSPRLTAVQVHGPNDVGFLSGVTAVFGYDSSFALKNDGTAWAWGYNSNGQLGDGTAANRLTPVNITALTNVISIDDVQGSVVFVRGDGTVWVTGWNGLVPLEDGTIPYSTSIVEVAWPE